VRYGEAIRALRDAAGVTQVVLARELGMPPSNLCMRENGSMTATRDEYERAEEHLLRIVGERRDSLRKVMDLVRSQLPEEQVAS
jgi:transcriptional regulator with XRE-family HTH domain